MTAAYSCRSLARMARAARLFEAIADSTPPPPHPARLIPQISELFDFGLYTVGQDGARGRDAFRRHAPSRALAQPAKRRGNAVAPSHFRHPGRALSEENSRSAGLALAVAALCQAFGRDPGVVFATGEIVLPSAPGARRQLGGRGRRRSRQTRLDRRLSGPASQTAARQAHRHRPAPRRNSTGGRSRKAKAATSEPIAERSGENCAPAGNRLPRLARRSGKAARPLPAAGVGDAPARDPRDCVAGLTLAAVAGAAHIGGAGACRARLCALRRRRMRRRRRRTAARASTISSRQDRPVEPLCFDAQREPLVVGGET